MPHIAIIGAGVTGVTTAYELAQYGFDVTVLDKHLFPSMETSFANGGQFSACNAEVWNQRATVLKGIKWMARKDAPLLLNPSFDVHKYAWLTEFLNNIKHYEKNTTETVRLALLARERMFAIAEKEQFDFNLERRGILHFYHTEADYRVATMVNNMLNRAKLERYAVTPDEIKQIEPTLTGEYYGGFYTPSDATGDIHKFTRGLATATQKYGVRYVLGQEVLDFGHQHNKIQIRHQASSENKLYQTDEPQTLEVDAIVVCGGVGSYQLGQKLGDRINVYPVKGYSITVNLRDQDSQNNAPWVSLLDESAKIVTSRLGADRFRVAGTAEFNGYNRDIRDDRVQPLINWVNRNFNISTDSVVPWAGLRPMMPDMMPRVQKGKREHVYYNTGHGHLGLTLSAATAALIAEEIARDFRQ